MDIPGAQPQNPQTFQTFDLWGQQWRSRKFSSHLAQYVIICTYVHTFVHRIVLYFCYAVGIFFDIF